jgi:hypothetical protein
MRSTSTLTALLCSTLLACAASSGGPPPATPTAPAAATNTSIAAAMPLAPGTTAEVMLPCDGAPVYFGPFDFQAEGQAVKLTSTYASLSGAQICGGGAWVDGQDAFIAVAGLGCVEGQAPWNGALDYAYAPGAGNSPANPVYLKLAVGEPRPAGCEASRVSLSRAP